MNVSFVLLVTVLAISFQVCLWECEDVLFSAASRNIQ